jgi:hypothetical protein
MIGETYKYGDYWHWRDQRKPMSLMTVSFYPLDIIVQWRRCGQTADYIANFLSYQFKESGRAMIILSTIINELLENCVKFSCDKQMSSSFTAGFFGDVALLEATNNTDRAQVERFQDFIHRLTHEDLEELFIAQIEDTGELMTKSAGLGLITLSKDYVSSMGFLIQPIPETSLYEVRVQLHLDPEGMDES